MQAARWILGAGAALFAGHFVAGHIVQRLLFCYPRRSKAVNERLAEAKNCLEFEGISYRMLRGANAPSGTDAPVAIYHHGNGSDILVTDELERFAAAYPAFIWIIWDYPGYGVSKGTPSEVAIDQAIPAVVRIVQGYCANADQRIVIFGFSLGGAVALKLANALSETGRVPCAVVLDAPFDSARAMARRICSWYHPSITDDTLNNVAALARLPVETRVLVLYNANDPVVPAERSEALCIGNGRVFGQKYGGALHEPVSLTNEWAISNVEHFLALAVALRRALHEAKRQIPMRI